MVELIRGSPSACMEHMLAEFESAYEADKLGTCIIVPTHTMARELRSRLSADGKTLIKSAVATLADFAIERIQSCPRAPFILGPLESEAIIRQILISKKNYLPLFYIEDELRQGLVPEIRAFISTTVDFDIDYPSKLGSLASDKSRQLALIRDAYLDALHSNGYIDQHELFKWTANDMAGQKTWIKRLFFFGLFEPKPAERELIKALCRACPGATYFAIHKDGCPAFADDLSWLESSAVVDLPISPRDEAIFSAFAKIVSSAGTDIRLGTYADAREEMRAVASQIKGMLSAGTRPDSIGVLLPMRRKSAPLVREVFSDFDIPVNVRVPISLSEAPAVQTVLGILDVVRGDYPAEGIIRILSSPHLQFNFDNGAERAQLNAGSVRYYAKKAGIRGGKQKWLDDPQTAAAEKDRTKAQEAMIQQGIRELIAALDSLQGEKTISEHVRSLRGVLERLELGKHQYFDDPLIMRRGQRALKIYLEVLKDLDKASRLFSRDKVSLEAFMELHRGMVAGEEYYPEPYQDNAVFVTGLRAGQLLSFDHLFILGMVEGDIPRIEVRNPFIPELEERKLDLLTGQDILRHERYYFLLALLNAASSAFLSTHRNEGDQPVLSSAFFNAVEEAFACEKMLAEDLTQSKTGAQQLVGEAIAGQDTPLSRLPYGCDLDASCLAINVEEFRRDGPYRTEYDGLLSGEGVLADIAEFHRDRAYSATQINMFNNCPLRFYLTYHQRMSPRRDEDEASPARTGIAVHRVLQRFYSERCANGRAKISMEEKGEAIARLRALGQEEATKGTSLAWRTYMNHFIGTDHPGVVSMFVDHELKNKLPGLTPRWIEMCYGKYNLDSGDPNNRVEPAIIPLDDSGSRVMRLDCRIDRVDVDSRGNFFVIDYKTGSPMSKCAAMKDLQIPLYILALEAEVPGSQGSGGGLYYMGSRKNTKIVPTVRDRDYADMMAGLGKIDEREWDRDELDNFRTERLGSILDAMTTGKFHPSISGDMSVGKVCGPACEYYGACRFDKSRTIEMGSIAGDGDEGAEE